MAGLRRRLNRALATHVPEKRLFVQSTEATRYIRFTPLTQLACGCAALLFAGWVAVATAMVVLEIISADTEATQTVVLHEAYQERLDELSGERDQRAAEARSAQSRFQVAMEQISRQQSGILASVEERRELAAALDLMRDRLQEAVAQRDKITAANDRLVAQVSEAKETLSETGRSSDDLDETLRTVSAALTEAVVARDTAAAESTLLTQKLTEMELRAEIHNRRQEEMIGELEQAIAMSFGPLEQLFETTDLDVDSLIAAVRSTHSGSGGPAEAVVVSTRSFDDPEQSSRFDKLMVDLDRMNLMRIAAGKVPYSMPVKPGYRFTSGYGVRNDPMGHGRRRHAGVDLAAPYGTPIYAAAEGVVVAAGRESGYGNVVRIRHEFGFETLYAHQSKIRVKVGQRVSLGEHIGDMGSTGRSTGVHLHYEVKLNGARVNPMIYMEAAKDVF